MKIHTTIIAATFGLLMMAIPNLASAAVVVRPVHPVVVQEVVPAAPFTTIEYYRPWACGNPYFRRHHWWRCR
jgi:hypothetical protein